MILGFSCIPVCLAAASHDCSSDTIVVTLWQWQVCENCVSRDYPPVLGSDTWLLKLQMQFHIVWHRASSSPYAARPAPVAPSMVRLIGEATFMADPRAVMRVRRTRCACKPRVFLLLPVWVGCGDPLMRQIVLRVVTSHSDLAFLCPGPTQRWHP